MTEDAIVMEPELVAAEAARTEMMRIPPAITDALVLLRDPQDVLDQAARAARALMCILADKPHKVIMNGEQYIENEDWLLVGHFYGTTAQIESDKYVEFGDVKGWEATAVLVARDGRVLGRATAMCLNDEEKWASRAKFAYVYCLGPEADHAAHGHSEADPGKNLLVWEKGTDGKNRPKKWRTQVGEERVPLFQLRSMAQTRASSKVHASVLRFVPVLAGFRGTPAEELPQAERVVNEHLQAPTPVSQDNPVVAGIGEGGTPVAVPEETHGQPDPFETVFAPERDSHYGSLPPQTFRIRKVTKGTHGILAFVHLDGAAQGLAVYKQEFVVLAKQCCADDHPVLIEVGTPASGKPYLKKLVAWSAL